MGEENQDAPVKTEKQKEKEAKKAAEKVHLLLQIHFQSNQIKTYFYLGRQIRKA